jgi:hypothetical protein
MDTQDWIFLSILFYTCSALAIGAYAFVIRRASLFEPIGQYLVFVSLFALPLPVRAWMTMQVEGDISPYLPQFAAYLPAALVLTALSLPVFAVGYYSRLARHLGNRLPLLAQRGLHGTRAGVLALTAFSCALVYMLTQEVGGLMNFLLLGYHATEATVGRGYLAVGLPWLAVATVAQLDRYAVSRQKLDLLGFGGLALANLAIHVITGNRSMIMYLAIVLCIFGHFRIRPISIKMLLPIVIIGFIALNIVGLIRGSEYQSIGEYLENTSSAAENVRLGDDSVIYTLTIGEFVVPFETLPQVIRDIGVTKWPWLGWSFLRAPVFFVPSAVFPDRPSALSNWYMENYYGSGYGANEGRQFFFLTEGYLNFGPIGVALVAAVWGVLWGTLHHWMLRGRDRFGVVLIYAVLVGYMFRCVTGDMVSLLVGTTQQSLAAVAVVLLVANIFYARRRLAPDN